jgi:hypothetical protein
MPGLCRASTPLPRGKKDMDGRDKPAQVTGNIGEVTHDASETGSTANQVLVSAQSPANESSHLKSDVANRFTRLCPGHPRLSS